MGREFETLVNKCQWLKGRGLVLDFKINGARRRWESYWNQRLASLFSWSKKN